LLSNAFKFTHHGHVTLTVQPVTSGWNPDNEELNRAQQVIVFEVSDTGIGISLDKQQIIFEAFQQADGSTSRKYGGTGLGLAISRELSRLLGGEIRLVSHPGAGSTFSLYIPQIYNPPRSLRKPALPEPVVVLAERSGHDGRGAELIDSRMRVPHSVRRLRTSVGRPAAESPLLDERPELINEVDDDRGTIRPGDRVFLIVENDVGFARLLLETVRDRGMKGLVTSLGAAAVALAREYKPDLITLDIFLPDIQGWRVLERLKNDLVTRHLPVCVISTEEARQRALASGAIAFLAKPIQSRDVLDSVLDQLCNFVSRRKRSVLVVEPSAEQQQHIQSVLAAEDVDVTMVSEPQAALGHLGDRLPDCVVVNPALTGLADDLVSLAGARDERLAPLPLILYGSPAGNGAWNRLGDACALRHVESPERLLDLAMLFTHRNIAQLDEDKRRMLQKLHESDQALAGRKVLVVDDDMRNIFALATVLEEHAMNTVSADNGRDAIRLLQTDPSIDIVLMDIMMPDMDGLETIRIIRSDGDRLRGMPIVAVTAKAMKGDREKCIEAGAWDYLAKPVDTEQLLAVLRNWLPK
jgi:CheY-like chemotaxis protein